MDHVNHFQYFIRAWMIAPGYDFSVFPFYGIMLKNWTVAAAFLGFPMMFKVIIVCVSGQWYCMKTS